MLSLPLIPPQPDAQTLYFNAPFRPLADGPPGQSSTPQHSSQPNHPHTQQHHRLLQQRRDEERKAHNARSPLAQLAADEAAIAQRKLAIRNFGAYWIRPPGVPKTLQAMTEELAELAEQEELLRQEQGLRDMQAQQELEEARERAAEAAATAQEGEGEGAEERDLDEEIPEAEEVGDEEEEDEEEYGEELSFNEDSLMEDGSQDGGMEEAELTGAARDEEELGVEHEDEMQVERDLDDSVPDAGSYQHTDTEAEDSLSDSELQDSFAEQQSAGPSTRSNGRRPQVLQPSNFETPNQDESVSAEASSGIPPARLQGGLQQRLRAQTGNDSLIRSPGNLNFSSSLLDSSFMGSSPVAQRGTNVRGAPRRRGRGS